ncbi:YciI family protein [Kineosporia succinea]|nr:YciI family protein [Kineosporia succinea]
MEFFCLHRDRPGSLPLREALLQEHWSFMDRFAETMIARGPVFDPAAHPGSPPVGSVHILGLPGPAAARSFAFDEPTYQAGAYRDVLLRRWRNRLGRTMWEFPGRREAGERFLVLGLGPSTEASPETSPETSPAPDRVPDVDGLIAYGPLLSDDARTWLGTAALVQASDAGQAAGLLAPDRYASVETYTWRFGGRPEA